MITFARHFLSPAQFTTLTGLLEADWDYGRALHVLGLSATHHHIPAANNAEAALTFVW